MFLPTGQQHLEIWQLFAVACSVAHWRSWFDIWRPPNFEYGILFSVGLFFHCWFAEAIILMEFVAYQNLRNISQKDSDALGLSASRLGMTLHIGGWLKEWAANRESVSNVQRFCKILITRATTRSTFYAVSSAQSARVWQFELDDQLTSLLTIVAQLLALESCVISRGCNSSESWLDTPSKLNTLPLIPPLMMVKPLPMRTPYIHGPHSIR